jgi:hypothetical protein
MTMPANPFDNYTDLIATIADTLNRQDLTAAIPAFIQLVEGEVNADDRFRIPPSMVRAIAPIGGSIDPVTGNLSPYAPLPADYLSMQNLRILELPPPGRIELMTTTQMDEQRSLLPDFDTPKFYSIIGEQMEFLPAPDTTYTMQMIYFAMVPPLSQSTTGSNWLLQRYPNIYYYGALLQAAPYLRDDPRIAVWQNMYDRIVANISISNDRAQFSGSTMRVRTTKRYR